MFWRDKPFALFGARIKIVPQFFATETILLYLKLPCILATDNHFAGSEKLNKAEDGLTGCFKTSGKCQEYL